MNELKKLWKELPPMVRLGIIGLGGYYAYLKIGGVFKSLKGKARINQALAEAEAKGEKPNLGDYDYVVLARKIYNAKSWYNDDEEAVYAVMSRILNDYDFIKMEEAFQDIAQTDMISYIRDFLNSEEIGKCNERLAKNGVTYRI